MTKQEWVEELIKSRFSTGSEGTDRLEECSIDEIADFFYSLHLQEIEKIREIIKDGKWSRYEDFQISNSEERRLSNTFVKCHNENLDKVLLAITDKNG